MVPVYFCPAFLEHRPPEGHPERPERLVRIRERLQKFPLAGFLDWTVPRAASREELEAVHSPGYLDRVEQVCGGLAGEEKALLDSGDTWASAGTLEAAKCSAGAGLMGVDQVLQGTHRSAFCCARPPGHHARVEAPMGFCLFNNIALAARYAQRKHGVERIVIVDWDVHHGNGTQEIFYEDNSVLFFSIHQVGHWPFSGERQERGSGKGEEYTINVPLAAGSEMGAYRQAFDRLLLPAVEAFRPQLVLISAGFDAHRLDPLGGIDLKTEDFKELTRRVMDLADRYAQGRIVSFLEGGYHLEALSASVEAHLMELAG